MNPRKKGVTLVELLLVVALLGIIMTALVPYIRTVHLAWQYGDVRTEMLQHGRVATDKVVDLLRTTKYVTGIDTTGAIGPNQGDYIEFYDHSLNNIVFFHNVSSSPYYQGDTQSTDDNDLLMRTISGKDAGTGLPIYHYSALAKSLTSVVFTYLDTEMNGTSAPNEVAAVRMDMTVSDSRGELTDTMPMSSLAYLREVVDGSRVRVVVGDYSAGEVWKFRPWGEVIAHTGWQVALMEVGGLSMNVIESNQTCWVSADIEVTKVNADLTSTTGTFDLPSQPWIHAEDVAVDNFDGTCWVVCTDSTDDFTGNPWEETEILIKLREAFSHPDGPVILNIDLPPNDGAGFMKVEVNPSDRSCWVMGQYNGQVLKYNYDATELQVHRDLTDDHVGYPTDISVNNADGSVWVSINTSPWGNKGVWKIDADGNNIDLGPGYKTDWQWPCSVAVDPSDGSCWVGDRTADEVVKLDSEGVEIFSVGGMADPQKLAVDPTTRFCWVADSGGVGSPNKVAVINHAGEVILELTDPPHEFWDLRDIEIVILE